MFLLLSPPSQSSQGGGHRTLLYGHAILLRHIHSSMVSTPDRRDCPTESVLSIISSACSRLCCSTWAAWRRPAHWRTSWLLTWACRKIPQVASLSEAGWSTHTRDHFSFCKCSSVTGEACWWTIHPASKQRSEGEKVRVGDDLILVSVSSERYLVQIIYLHLQLLIFASKMWLVWLIPVLFSPQHLSYASGDLMVDASFMQTLWTMTPVMSGCELAEGSRSSLSCKIEILVTNLNVLWIPNLSSRFSVRRLRAQAFPRSHGRMFGNSRSRPRGRPAQVVAFMFDSLVNMYLICNLEIN